MLYSVGSDEKDDGGVSFEALGLPPMSDEVHEQRLPRRTYVDDHQKQRAYVGDWILWPPTPTAAPTEPRQAQ